MALVLKSNRTATASLGNINGINGKQDWSIFLDFENEVYQTKQSGVVNQNYLLTDVVTASRANLLGSPISISKSGIERKITSTSEIRTALLKNGRFGLLAEDTNQNFFLNSASPISQTITLPASTVPIIVSCEGSGSVVVSGGVVESGLTVDQSGSKVFKRTSTTNTTPLIITILGTLTHVQVELATGTQTASSKVTTDATTKTRAREIVKLNQNLFNSFITNKAAFTIVAQTIDYNTAVNQSGYSAAHRIGVENSDSNIIGMVLGGNSVENKYYHQIRIFEKNAQFSNTTIQYIDSSNDLNYAYTSAFTVSNKMQSASNGFASVAEATLPDSTVATNINFGAGYGSPIGVNGLRGIVTKLAVYDRVLSDAELIAISKSWK